MFKDETKECKVFKKGNDYLGEYLDFNGSTRPTIYFDFVEYKKPLGGSDFKVMQEALKRFVRDDLRRKICCGDCNSIISDVQVNSDGQRGLSNLSFNYRGFEVCFGRMYEGFVQNFVNGVFLRPGVDKARPLFRAKNMIIDLKDPGAARKVYRRYKEIYKPMLL
jgi:hypothetical protein